MARLRLVETVVHKQARNPRVRAIDKDRWARDRKAKVGRAIDNAAGAKAMRTHEGVTQTEMGDWYGVTASAICRWESGFCLSWTNDELVAWGEAVRIIASDKRSDRW